MHYLPVLNLEVLINPESSFVVVIMQCLLQCILSFFVVCLHCINVIL